jgi:Arylsulfotransferase (ASST)
MNNKKYTTIMTLIATTLFIVSIFNSMAFAQNQEHLIPFPSLNREEGTILYSPMYDTTTYLINETGVVNHTWQSSYTPTLESYMVENGSIIRSIWSGRGGFQHIAWDSTVLWEYLYTRDSSYYSHDIIPLPNGDVIMIMQEIKSRASAIQAGRDPFSFGNDFRPDFLIQVHQTGPTSGEIVWEWHLWDHLIQDYDFDKDNYGNVSQHPELIDINFGEDFVGDWIHMNSVDYNPKFDQILMSAHNFDEVWIIDHSTTTEEAASHEGGQYNHGGDILYRWGNPQAYDHGTPAGERLYFQHQVTWIKPGLPGAGNILVFSNGNNRPGGAHSSADEFTPDVNNDTGEYHLLPDGTYGPSDLTWHYLIPLQYYSSTLSGVQRMLNGNTLICSGEIGTFIEVTPEKQIVWTYYNPYPHYQSPVYKIEYIPPYIPPPPPPPQPVSNLECNGTLSWSNIKPGATVHGSFQVMNIGDNDSLLNWTVNNTITWGTWTFSRTSGENLTPDMMPVTVNVYVVIPKDKNTMFQGNLTIQNENNASDVATIPVSLTTTASASLIHTNPLLIRILHWVSSLFFLRHNTCQPLEQYSFLRTGE